MRSEAACVMHGVCIYDVSILAGRLGISGKFKDSSRPWFENMPVGIGGGGYSDSCYHIEGSSATLLIVSQMLDCPDRISSLP